MSLPSKPRRLLYIDNIRVLCIALVVVMHAAVSYSGFGSWYYNEPTKLNLGSMLFFGVFQSHLQAFFMSLFFLISGYFVPASLERKGAGPFLRDRLFRLGVPLLVYVFVLHPLVVKAAYPNLNLVAFYRNGMSSFGFISWTGPLWFVEALLVFTLACLPFAGRLKRLPESPAAALPAGPIWLLMALITAGAFGLRLVYPVGTSVANLQFGYFAAYGVAFVVGVLAGVHRWLERISFRSAKRWWWLACGFSLPLWLGAMAAGGAAEGRSDFNGGMNVAALAYAFWESFFCVAIIVAILGFAREKLNFQKSWMRFLADNAFGVYVFHALVLVLLSQALRTLALPAVPKFALVTLIALPASWTLAWALRQVPPLRRVFS